MIKQVKFTYKGMNQDVTKSKHSFEFYYEGKNIRISTIDSQSTHAITNEKGNEQVLSLPSPSINTVSKKIKYNNSILDYDNDEINEQISNGILKANSNEQIIIGYSLTRNSIILFSTDSNGFDCIWEVKELLEGGFELSLIYIRNLNFNTNSPIQSIFNYENDKITKVYWVDGINQLRFLNINHSIDNGDLEELIDIHHNSINIVGEFEVSQPTISEISSGGIHTSGMIQYAYNLYRLNGAQTIISPLSELISLDKGANLGGGSINEVLGSSPIVNISNIDEQYSHVKLYSIKYTSYNQDPTVSLIMDKEIDNYDKVTHFDDGNVISDISISEFLFLGSNPFIPSHIASKDNRLFASRVVEKSFDFDIDMRAFSFNNSGVSKVYDKEGSFIDISPTQYSVPTKHDSINKDYKTYKYQSNGLTLGGEGKFIKYSIAQKSENELEGSLKYLRFFKDNEVYRLGIIFYNKFGQASDPIWIADLVAPEGNLQGKYNTLNVELKIPELLAHLDTLDLDEIQTPVGYKILRADRTLLDRTIICQGAVSGMMCQSTKDVEAWRYWTTGGTSSSSLDSGKNNREAESINLIKLPIPVTRSFNNNTLPTLGTNHLKMMNYPDVSISGDGPTEGYSEIYTDKRDSYKRQNSWQYTKMMQMYSPDILFNSGISFGNNLQFSAKGLIELEQTDAKYIQYNIASLEVDKEASVVDTSQLNLGRMGLNLVDQTSFLGPMANDGERGNIVFHQYHKKYTTFHPNTNVINYNVYGSPEVVEKGQGATSYNNDSHFKYANTLATFLSDKRFNSGAGDDDPAITSINSFGCRSLMFVEGDKLTEEPNRRSIEQILNNASISNSNGLLMMEIKRPDSYLYNGNIYGGNTYESKSRSTYIEIGNYTDINTSINIIESPGDTYVQNFKFARLSKTDTIKFDVKVLQSTEIVEFPVETTINLLNRNDLSASEWDNSFQPKYDDYHEYNRVYSQSPNLIERTSELFKFKKIINYDTRIISSKLKVPGEFIDNWTDFLENEVQDLDGKYGPINALINHNDDIFALQDEAIALIGINPRVQTQGEDGINIELGTGGILHDYTYLTTSGGTINKWSVFGGNSGFYYYDAYNRTFNLASRKGVLDISTTKGLHSFFQNKINYELIKKDNPLLNAGVNGIFDKVNDTAYLTVHQRENMESDVSSIRTNNICTLKTFNISTNAEPSRCEYSYPPLVHQEANNIAYFDGEGDIPAVDEEIWLDCEKNETHPSGIYWTGDKQIQISNGIRIEMECLEEENPVDTIYSFEVVGQREACCQNNKTYSEPVTFYVKEDTLNDWGGGIINAIIYKDSSATIEASLPDDLPEFNSTTYCNDLILLDVINNGIPNSTDTFIFYNIDLPNNQVRFIPEQPCPEKCNEWLLGTLNTTVATFESYVKYTDCNGNIQEIVAQVGEEVSFCALNIIQAQIGTPDPIVNGSNYGLTGYLHLIDLCNE